MSHAHFTLILTAYVTLVLLDYFAGSLPIHPDRIRIDAVKEYLSKKSKAFIIGYSVVSSAFLLTFIVGLIGLYFLWPLAPYLFTAGFLGKLADSIIIPIRNEKNQFERFLEELQFLFEGFLLAILFFGPARHLFAGLA